MNEDERLKKIWDDFEKSEEYLAQTELSTKLPRYVDFYESRQHSKAEESNKYLPRPTFNICSMISDNKETAILSKPYKLVYKSYKLNQELVRNFNRFAEFQTTNLDQEELDAEAVETGCHEGTAFVYYYYDAESDGYLGNTKGALKGRVIDTLDMRFENPNQRDIQKQGWIIIRSRESIESIKAKADKDVDLDLIVTDENKSYYREVEQNKDSKVTTLTRMFKQNGEVYVEQAVKGTIVRKAFPFTPNVLQELKNIQATMDAPNNESTDKYEEPTYKATLYPIAVFQFKKRKNSIYGIGVIEGIISNQIAINNNASIVLHAFQKNSNGKWVMDKQNAQKGQKITNALDQVLVDHTGTMQGYKVVQGQNIPNGFDLDSYIIDTTRMVEGATQVTTGEIIGSNMSGSAISNLQATAEQTLTKIRKNFKDFKKQQGKILAQFYKLYYTDEEYTYIEKDEEGNDVEFTGVFNSSDYSGSNFQVVTETQVGTYSSTSGDIAMLEMLLNKGLITADQFIEAYPEEAISNKTKIQEMLKENKELEMLKAQVNELTADLKDAIETITKQQEVVGNVRSIINENNALKTELARQKAEYISLHNEAVQKINEANGLIQEHYEDARVFAEELNRRNANESV